MNSKVHANLYPVAETLPRRESVFSKGEGSLNSPIRPRRNKMSLILFMGLLTLTPFGLRLSRAAMPPGTLEQRDMPDMQHQHSTLQEKMTNPPMQKAEATQRGAEGPALTLEDLERMALQNNPTLAQGEALIRAAKGRKQQAGLYPNPIVGYQGSEFALRAFSNKSEHFFFVEQNIVTAGKLKKSQAIFAQEQVEAEDEAEAQKFRVQNTVRLLFYEALGAQQFVELRGQLAQIAREAVKISEELYNVGQADQPDLLEAEIEAQRAELDLNNAENDREQVWQLLTTVVGVPSLQVTRLEGNLEKDIPALDQQIVLANLLRDSPEIKKAQAGIERARAVVARAKAEPIPDLFLRGGVGYSTERLELARGILGATGAEVFVEAGIRLPIFNRNQGNIAAAQAEEVLAEREVQRQELVLRARLASAFRPYLKSMKMVERYRQDILPRAQKAYDLYLTSFRQMAAAYPQVLIAQRTLFQVRTDYVKSLVDLWENAIRIQGFLLTGGLDAPGTGSPDGRSESGVGNGINIHGQGIASSEGRDGSER